MRIFLHFLLYGSLVMFTVVESPAQTPKSTAPAVSAKLLSGRTLKADERAKLMLAEGGSTESLAAIELGLVWLARQQKADGSFPMDGSGGDPVAGTGLAVLCFLGAGETHTGNTKNAKVVNAGLGFLQKSMLRDGSFNVKKTMYTHGIATMALCEAAAMTKDPQIAASAASAVTWIIKGQAEDGSWGYSPGTRGDTSIVGWQIQALHSARLAGIIFARDVAYARTETWLKSASSEKESRYGYTANGGGTPTLTASGLLSRYYIGTLSPKNEAFVNGIEYISKAPVNAAAMNSYHLYFASQVMRYAGGESWVKWNEKARDALIETQDTKNEATKGSWKPSADTVGAAGRLCSTCFNLLTLEVYNRFLPIYPRANE